LKDNFCVIPWVHMASKPIGTARVCCLMSNSHSTGQGIISDDQGRPYNLGTDEFDEIKNGERVRKVRLAMLNNERLPDCDTCWIKEDMGASSRRLVTNRMYKDEFTKETAQQHTDAQGYTDWQPSYWDLRFGNLCNLKCVMCHPASSNQWYEDYVLLNGTTKFGDSGIKINLEKTNNRYRDQGQYDWWNNEQFWIRLEEKIPYLKQVYLVGGEPMLIQPHYDFLQKIIDSGRADQVTLEYDTNLTSVQDRALRLWKHFKRVWLRVSIDDQNEQFDYVRYPSRWKQVIQNLDRVQGDNIKMDFTITWQVLTAFTTPKLLELLEKYTGNKSIRILSTPDYFDVKILPPATKQELLDLYQKHKEQYPHHEVGHLIKYIQTNLDNYNTQALDKCFDTLRILDKSRKTNWQSTFQILYNQLQKDPDYDFTQ